MKTLSRLILAAALGLLVVSNTVQAGPVWSLQWEFGTNALISDSGRSAVLFTSHNTTSSAASTNALVASVGEASYEPPGKLDHITRQNYGMFLKLTDLASHATHYFWFAGSLTGTLSQHTSTLVNHYVTPTSYANIRLGNDIYKISLDPFTTPGLGQSFQRQPLCPRKLSTGGHSPPSNGSDGRRRRADGPDGVDGYPAGRRGESDAGAIQHVAGRPGIGLRNSGLVASSPPGRLIADKKRGSGPAPSGGERVKYSFAGAGADLFTRLSKVPICAGWTSLPGKCDLP